MFSLDFRIFSEEYEFAIIILALRQGLLEEDREFLNQMPKTKSYQAPQIVQDQLIENEIAKLDENNNIQILFHC